MAVFTFINIRGLELTGWSLTIIQIGVMVPLLIFTVYGITKGTGSGFSPMLPEGESFLTSLQPGAGDHDVDVLGLGVDVHPRR